MKGMKACPECSRPRPEARLTRPPESVSYCEECLAPFSLDELEELFREFNLRDSNSARSARRALFSDLLAMLRDKRSTRENTTHKSVEASLEASCFDPMIVPLVSPRAGGPLVISVNLTRPHDERLSSGLPADWQSLPIVACAIGVGVSFETGCAEGVILMRRDAASIPCTLVGVIGQDTARVELAIGFYERGRYSGELRRSLALDAAMSRERLATGAPGNEPAP